MADLGFADDKPIQTDDQDLLGRSAFAKHLATAIAGWQHKESLVIALMGAWGSGKSSIKNLALQHFTTVAEHQVIEFNPWEWGGQERLSASFFEEISRAIQRRDRTRTGKQLANALRRYGRTLNTGAALLDGVSKYLPLLLGSAIVTTFLSTWFENPKVQTVMATLGALSGLAACAPWLTKAGKLLLDQADSLENTAKDNELTLKEIREEVRALLDRRAHPLLIVMDDIDRLSSEQMKALFQLIKANMDFPNVVFLLLFQRDIVEQGLKHAGFAGAAYLEKIIQVPFNVPVMSEDCLESVLSERLDAILGSEPQLRDQFDRDYWSGVYRKGLRPFFRNLRDVYRYTSTLTFHCRLLRGVDVAEINAVDLFALECLRTFAPASYEALPRHKLVLTGSSSFQGGDSGEKARITELLQGIVALAPTEWRSSVDNILKQLFPTLDWVFKNTSHAGGIHARWLRESRVCRVETFDRYFELTLPASGVSNSLMHALSLLLTDSERFCEILCDQKASQQKAILSRLEPYVDEVPLDHSAAVVETLLKTGEVVVGGESSLASLSAPVQAYFVLRHFLQRHDAPIMRSQLLLAAFERTQGFIVLERVLMAEASSREESNASSLDDAGFGQLLTAYVAALLKRADQRPEAFLAHWNFVSFAYRLNRFADGAGRQWIQQHVTTVERFLLFAVAVVSKSTGYAGNTVSEHYFVRVSTLDALLGVEACQDWLSLVQRNGLSGMALQAINLIAEALARHERGEQSEYD